jgi:hypothetical protein
MNTQHQAIEGLEEFDQTDIIVPRRTLVQPMTKLQPLGIKAAPGAFIDKTSKKVYGEPFEIVVLTLKKNRALSHPYGAAEKGYRCWSSDGKTPDGDVENPVSSSCAGCPEANKDLQYNLLCMDVKETLENGVPSVFWFTARKSSRFRAQDLINNFVSTRTSPRARIVTMEGIQPANMRQGNYYVANFRDVTMMTDQVQPYVEAAVALYATAVENAPADDEIAQVSDDSTPF